MSIESYERRRVLERENAAAAEAEARALEAEGVRMRAHLPPDPLAERRRLERETAARVQLEADLAFDEIERAKAAHRQRQEPEQQPAPSRTNWVTEWRG